MESVASNSPRSDRCSARFNPTQQIEGRIVRAFHHRIRLLHRSGANFFILGTTGNVYTVSLSATPTCTCPDRTTPCKHMLFVFLRVLKLSLDDTCLRRRTLRPCHLIRLLSTPTSPDSLARPRVRNMFHQLSWEEERRREARERSAAVEIEESPTCPVCMEEMGKEERVVACGVCGNSLHEECFLTWKRSRGRRVANCVICRARWREREQERRYINLSAYVGEEDDAGLPGGGGLCVA